MKNKNVLIVGCNGFLGSNLSVAYLSELANVTGVDVGSRPKVEGITYFSDREDFFSGKYSQNTPDFDLIINCAGRADVSLSFTDPKSDFDLNVLIPKKIFEFARLYSPESKILQLSSAAVYGNPAVLPVSVDTVLNPLSPYGHNKLISEVLADSYVKNFGLKISVGRIFSVYGEGNPKQVLWDLCSKIVASEDKYLVIEGTGSESRDFIHIDDLINQVKIIEHKAQFNAEKINMANGVETRISVIAELLESYFGLSKLEYSCLNRPGYPNRWQSDISFLNDLGYKQKINLKEGITRYCNWFMSNQNTLR
jgi:UDP-glucose 4-epimerase